MNILLIDLIILTILVDKTYQNVIEAHLKHVRIDLLVVSRILIAPNNMTDIEFVSKKIKVKANPPNRILLGNKVMFIFDKIIFENIHSASR